MQESGKISQGRGVKGRNKPRVVGIEKLVRELEIYQRELEAQNEELRQAQSHLELSCDRFSSLYDFAPVGYFTFSRSGLILDVNLKGAKLLGADRAGLVKTSFSVHLDKESRSSFITYLKRLFQEGHPERCEVRLRPGRGMLFAARIESVVVKDREQGWVSRSMLIDISDRVQAEEALRDSEERYRLLFESNPHPMWVVDTESFAFLAVNEAAIDHYGYSREEFLSMTIQDIRPADEVSLLTEGLAKSSGRPVRAGVWQHRKKDGAVIDVEVTGQRIFFSGRNAQLVIANNVTERNRAQAALRQSERRFRALIENSSDAIALLDASGKIFYASPSTLRIFGYVPEKLIGKTALELIHPEDRGRMKHLFSDLAKRSEGEATAELRFRHKSGVWRWVEGIGSNLLREPGVHAIVVNYRDITDRKEAEEAIGEKNLRIEEASRARNRFFSYMSHELKTPVNSIVGFAQLLRNGNYGALAPEQTAAVGRINNNARELIHLINNILDLAKLETGKIGLQAVEADLKELVDKVLLNFEPLLQEKGLRFRKEIDPDFPERFLTDPMQVRSILMNLISNAVKFTDRGEIRLRLMRLAQEGIRLEVSDTGMGISEEYLGRIFEEYEQRGVAREAKGNYTGGSGLGLAIVKKMVDLLSGRIEVASTPGEGTVFTVFIPEAPPNDIK
ncbi:MAG: PAS domain S-box protein [Candidatus Manganitrophus sp.]|nr:MAG: PAS domain S-box protein [Candidatus Manganitrophus sp.]